MMAIGSDAVMTAFVLFCRIGSCLMLMPGFSSQRIPVNIRLFTAFTVTLVLTPLLSDEITKSITNIAPTALTRLFISETLIGILIGFLARIFFGALETLAGSIAMSIGLSSPLAGPMEENEPLPALSSLITLTATVLIFSTNLHWEVLWGLSASYSALPISGLFDSRFDLVQISNCLTSSFLLSLRISSPFLIYAIIINFAIGLASKLSIQIPIYFVAVPAVLVGGLLLFYALCEPFMHIFSSGFSAWLAEG